MSGCSAAVFGRGAEPERPKVVVLNVKGGGAVRGDIVNLLQAEYPLVPKKRYVKTARSLKATKLRARHITKVSAELGISAVVSGRVKRRGKRRYLYVTVHDGASGVKIERFRVRLTRKRRLTKEGSAQLESKLKAALAEVKPSRAVTASDGDDDDDEADDGEKPEKLSKAERRRRAREEKKRKREEARERKRAEREAKKQAAAEERARKQREREERAEAKRREREAERREAAAIKKVVNPKTRDDGQAIDDEEPPGF